MENLLQEEVFNNDDGSDEAPMSPSPKRTKSDNNLNVMDVDMKSGPSSFRKAGEIISQVGDSTDEDEKENGNDFLKLPDKLPEKYRVSFILKKIGQLVLIDEGVRRKYKKIKKDFIPQDKKGEYEEYDNKLGRGWGILIRDYIFSRKFNFAAKDPDCREEYYKMNKTMIDTKLDQNDEIKKLTDTEKGEKYLEKIFIMDIHAKIQEMHMENENKEYIKSRSLTRFIMNGDGGARREDAKFFLARLKGSMKLDKDFLKNHFYHELSKQTDDKVQRYEERKHIDYNSDYTDNERLIIQSNGKMVHDSEDSYEKVGNDWDNLIIGTNRSWKEFLLSVLRDDPNSGIHNCLRLQKITENILRTEMKRNSAAFLTNAMFFDLVDVGLYKMTNISTKLPMAIQERGAAEASKWIDRWSNFKLFDYTYYYDPRAQWKNIDELAKRDKIIFIDWLLKYPVIYGDLSNIQIHFNQPLSIGDEVTIKVTSEVFFKLIHTWYGIEILKWEGDLDLDFVVDERTISLINENIENGLIRRINKFNFC